MIFSKDTRKRIGANINALICGLGYENTNEFIVFLGNADKKGKRKIEGLSKSMLDKIIDGTYDIKEKTLRFIASYFEPWGINYYSVIHDDLTFIEANELNKLKEEYAKNKNARRLMFDCYFKRIKKILPIIKISSLKKYCSFYKAIRFDLFENPNLEEYLDLNEYLNSFSSSFENDCIPEAGVNYLTIIMFIFLAKTMYQSGSIFLENSFVNKEGYTIAKESREKYNKVIEKNKIEEERLELVKYFKNKDKYLKNLNTFSQYKDFVSFYLALSYIFGFVNNEENCQSIEEMQNFGLILMKDLKKLGNKYAKDYFNLS